MPAKPGKAAQNVLIEVETPFDPVPYETQDVGTSITLLTSPEEEIVIRALSTLSKYADIKDENVKLVYEKGLLQEVLKLVDSKNVIVLRFSLKLIATLTSTVLQAKVDMIVKNATKLIDINQLFMTSTDGYVQEFCSHILSLTATEQDTATSLLASGVVTTIFSVLNASDDPDVQLNTLIYLELILLAPKAAFVIPKLTEFSCKLFFCYLKSPISEIRVATLQILDTVTCWKNHHLQNTLKDEKIVEQLLDVIFDKSLKEMHKKCFKIILTCTQCTETCSYYIKSEQFVRFCDWAMTCPGKYILPSVNIFKSLSSQRELRQTLFDFTVEDTILSFFRTQDHVIFCVTCEAVCNMSSHRFCCKKILTPIVLKRLIEMLRQKDVPVIPFHETALTTLYIFLKRNETTLEMMVKFKYVDAVVHSFLSGKSNYSVDGFDTLLGILYVFSNYPKTRIFLVDRQVYTLLLETYENEPYETAKQSLLVLNQLVEEVECRQYFVELNGADRILEKVKATPNEDLFKATLLYIRHLFSYKRIAMTFLYSKAPIVLSNFCKEIKREIPLVNQLVNMMYDVYLPLKLHHLNRLDFTDHLTGRFYLIRDVWRGEFPFLETLTDQGLCIRSDIYLVDYSAKIIDLTHRVERVPTAVLTTGAVSRAMTASKAGDLTSLAAKAGATSVDRRRSILKRGSVSKQQKVSIKSIGSSEEVMEQKNLSSYLVWQTTPPLINFGGISDDPFLPKYVEKLRRILHKDPHTCFSHLVSSVACFVDAILSGPEEDCTVNDSFFEVHLSKLKHKLGTSIIPVGFLRYGKHCERALLFKAFADKLHVPCSLVRQKIKGKDKFLYWNEVPLIADESFPNEDDFEKTYVTYAVVDLMKDVGKLILSGSEEANRYCGIKI